MLTGSPWVGQHQMPTSREPSTDLSLVTSLQPWGQVVFPVDVLGHSLDQNEGVVHIQLTPQLFSEWFEDVTLKIQGR